MPRKSKKNEPKFCIDCKQQIRFRRPSARYCKECARIRKTYIPVKNCKDCTRIRKTYVPVKRKMKTFKAW